MKKSAFAISLALAFAAPVAPAKAQHAHQGAIHLWRLDCGSIEVSDFDVFSDTYLYVRKPKHLTASCYLIHNAAQDKYLLWDTGVAGPSREWVFTIGLKERITDQLKRIGVSPAAITYVGISHYHVFRTTKKGRQAGPENRSCRPFVLAWNQVDAFNIATAVPNEEFAGFLIKIQMR